MSLIDLVVVGGGITGLIVARNLASLYGIKVVVIEATDKLGGHVQPLPHQVLQALDIDLNSAKRPYSYVHSKFVIRKHRLLHEEIVRYRPSLHVTNVTSTSRFYVQSKLLGNILWKDYLIALQAHALYKSTIDKLNYDADCIVIEQGYCQIAYDHLDLPFAQYIAQELNLQNQPSDALLYEFIHYFPYALLGAYSHEISTLQLLHLIAMFQGFQSVLNFLVSYDTIEEGFAGLIGCLYNECLALKVEFIYSKPVIEVAYEHKEREKERLPHYEYPPSAAPLSTAIIKLASGEVIKARTAVLTIPLNCLLSIKFTPPLPHILHRAAERCNASRHTLTVYSTGMVSNRLNRLYCLDLDHTIQESNVLYRNEESNMCLVQCNGKRSELLSHHNQDNDKESVSCMVQSIQSIFPTIDANSVYVQDSISSAYLRSQRFVLRAGTGKMHADAHQVTRGVWEKSLCLYIACNELAGQWTGWMEGGVAVAREAVRVLTPHLIPPKVPRNFAMQAK